MTQEQTLDLIAPAALLENVKRFREQGFRLVQICATRLADQFELTYSFDLQNRLSSIRLHLGLTEPRLPSISSIYACSVLYENEIHDLFNIKVDGMALDFEGNFYRTSVKYAFGSIKPPAAKPATDAAPSVAPGSAAPAAIVSPKS